MALPWTNRITVFFIIKNKSLYRETWLSATTWQIYFQSNLNLFFADSSVQYKALSSVYIS